MPSRFYTPSDSLVLREGQGSSVQGPDGTPAPGPLDPQEQRDQQPWTLGAPPPFGADSSEHVKLDRLQVGSQTVDRQTDTLQTDRQTPYRQTDTLQTDRHTGGQTDRQTGGQIDSLR